MLHKFFIQYAQYILLTVVFFLHLSGYILIVMLPKQFTIFIYFSMVIIDIGIAYKCGSLIKEFYLSKTKDFLTGVNNRDFFYSVISNEIKRLEKDKTAVSLLMIDLDNFKAINDKYGHIIGDKLMKQLANLLTENIRYNDYIVRWGGDEFVIILPKTDREKSYILAERIRNTIQDYEFSFDDIKLKITISVGIVSIDEKIDIEQFIDFADKALYKAKERRNQVIIWNNTINSWI